MSLCSLYLPHSFLLINFATQKNQIMKSIYIKLLLIALPLIFFASLDLYSKNTKSGNSIFLYEGDNGPAPNTCLYKVDNELRKEYTPEFYEFGYNTANAIGGFKINLKEGKHTFEVVLNDKGINSSSKNIFAKRIYLDMKAGTVYNLIRNDFNIEVEGKRKNKVVKTKYKVEDVPVLPIPQDSFVTVTYIPANNNSTHPFITRIDDMVTNEIGDIYGVCDYSKPFDFKYFNKKNGELNLKIKAGKHKFEYLILGNKIIDGLVHTESFIFQPGKNYEIVMGGTFKNDVVLFKLKFIEKSVKP